MRTSNSKNVEKASCSSSSVIFASASSGLVRILKSLEERITIKFLAGSGTSSKSRRVTTSATILEENI